MKAFAICSLIFLSTLTRADPGNLPTALSKYQKQDWQGDHQVEYLAKDTRLKQFIRKRYTTEEFVNILIQHVPHRGRHAMRYFGLLAPRSKARTWAAVFVLLKQKQRPHPRRLGWRWLRRKAFGIDPLLDSFGQPMH